VTLKSASNPFDWSGGHPALDLLNTLDERPSDAPVELLSTYGDLVRFAELSGLVEPSLARKLRPLRGPACARAVRRTKEIREHLFIVLTAHHAGGPVAQCSLDVIAVEVRRAHSARTFASTKRRADIVHRWISPTSPEVPVHACALAVESLLVSADHHRIRKCGAEDCDVFFIDTSKAHRRQWCSMQNCGNREKQRRWRSGQD
jgi:predicted RNA-binding Zn ribbon-like protein